LTNLLYHPEFEPDRGCDGFQPAESVRAVALLFANRDHDLLCWLRIQAEE